MERIKEIIPNTLTSANLVCGCIGIVLAFDNQLLWASTMIWIAGGFDFLDGFSARLLKVSSDIGKQLDSLADMVTFGVLPSIIVFQLLNQSPIELVAGLEAYIPYFAFVLAVFSAVRLAKFNIDTRQSDTFIGVPTPANAICISSFPFILSDWSTSTQTLNILLIIYSVVFSWLMIAEIKMLALKFKGFGWKSNEARWIFIGLSILLVVFFQVKAIPMVIIGYILTSIVNNMLSVQKEQIS